MKNIKKCLVKKFLRLAIKNTLILVRITFLDRTDIEFSNKINFTAIHIVYKRRIGRYAIMWPQNDPDKWNLFFFITRITIRPEISKKKIIPRCTKVTITSLGRSDGDIEKRMWKTRWIRMTTDQKQQWLRKTNVLREK